MNAKILAVVIVFITNFRLCQGKRYDSYAMYRATPMAKEQLKFLQNMETQSYIDVVFWKRPYKLFEAVQFIVSPKDIKEFHDRCKHFSLEVEEVQPDIQELFDTQNIVRRYMRFQTDTYSWEMYHTLEDINQWMTDIVKKHPKISELIHVGKSVENRDIYALKIDRKHSKGTVIVEAGMHGNEWISTEFVTFLAMNLLSLNSSRVSDVRLIEVGNFYEWLLVPVVNPDGYVYSHVYDRLWRKNRRFFENGTYGVNLDRNFDYNFGKFGTSNTKADNDYCGPRPFSEPESLELSNIITQHSKNLKFYFSIQAYGQKIILPYGDKILHVDNYLQCENYGKQAIIKMFKMSGVKYAIGNSYDTQGHKISGDSASWVKENFDVPYVYTFLVRDAGKYGYAMPPSEIIPTCEETLSAVLEIMTTHVKKLRADIFGDSAVGDGPTASYRLILCVVAFWLTK